MVSTMKLDEIRERSVEELGEEVTNLRKKMFELRFAKSLHKLEDTSEIAKTKRAIAQIKSVIREKQLTK